MRPSTPTADAIPRWTWRPLPRGRPAEPLARDWLGGQLHWPGDALPIHRDSRGRPQLGAPLETYDCNWSHSGGGLLVVLGHGLQVGVDLEWRRPRTRALELARRYFTAAEADWLDALGEVVREDAFLRLWCAKEAVLKAHGHGLAFGLDRLEFGPPPGAPTGALRLRACDPALGRPQEWALQELAPAPGFLGALAWRAGGG